MLKIRNGFLTGFCLSLLAVASAAAADQSQLRWSGVERIVAFGDVHGAFAELTDLLQDAGVIDKDLHWIGGSTHVVSVGDLVDRGANSRKILDLLMRLQDEAPTAGGYVHVLLGNHEVMNLTGELLYTAVGEFTAFADEEPPALRQRKRSEFLKTVLRAHPFSLDGEEPSEVREEALEQFLKKFPTSGPGQSEIAPVPTEPLAYFMHALTAASRQFDELRPAGYYGHQTAFGPDGYYGKWLVERPIMIIVNDTAFVHGGLPPVVAGSGLQSLNEQLTRELKQYTAAWYELLAADVLEPEDDLDGRPGIARERIASRALDPALLEIVDRLESVSESDLFFGTGPMWYRGTAQCYALHDSDVAQAALDRLDAKRVAVGHTPTWDAVMRSRLNGRAILMDTGMLTEFYHGQPSALIIEGDGIRALYGQTGKLRPIEAEPRRVGWRDPPLTDDELEEILRTGKVVAAEEVGEGVTHSLRLTIRKNGITVKALFKSEANDSSDTDHYKNEVAAYRVDRLIKLDMVPVTVIGEYEGKTGSLQFWIDNLVNEIERTEWGITGTDWCRLEDQWNLLYVFDALIYNTDRTMQNMTYEEPEWLLRLIDHSRSLGTRTGRPPYLKRMDLKISNELRANLAALDHDTLAAELGTLLTPQEIRALLKRRDRLLKD